MGVSAAKIQSLVRGRAARTACKARMAKVVKAQASRRTGAPTNGRGLCGGDWDLTRAHKGGGGIKKRKRLLCLVISCRTSFRRARACVLENRGRSCCVVCEYVNARSLLAMWEEKIPPYPFWPPSKSTGQADSLIRESTPDGGIA